MRRHCCFVKKPVSIEMIKGEFGSATGLALPGSGIRLNKLSAANKDLK
jgi:hypothetical protein